MTYKNIRVIDINGNWENYYNVIVDDEGNIDFFKFDDDAFIMQGIDFLEIDGNGDLI